MRASADHYEARVSRGIHALIDFRDRKAGPKERERERSEALRGITTIIRIITPGVLGIAEEIDNEEGVGREE